MPIQRTRHDDQYSTAAKHQQASKNCKIKTSTSNMSTMNGNQRASNNSQDARAYLPSSNNGSDNESNISEIRRLIREQTNLGGKNGRYYNSNSGDSSDELDVPIRKFTPLPDIPRMDDAYFRTESNLVKRNNLDLDSEYSFIDERKQEYVNNHNNASIEPSSSSSSSTTTANTASNNNIRSSFNAKQSRKETRYHFGSSTYSGFNKKPFNHRLPSLEKNINHSIQNTMDLDEDLPMNPEPDRTNQRQIYTSPGDRIISPIKRPNAPSPAASAYRRKSKPQSDSDDSDTDVIIL